MKKWVELQVATNPCGSSISASSAPAFVAWMQARMQLSLEWLLSFGSCTSGGPRRTWTVNRRMPRTATAGSGALYSGMMTTVAGPMVTRGSWYGVAFTPRETMRRICTSSDIALTRNVSWSASARAVRSRPTSRSRAFAPS